LGRRQTNCVSPDTGQLACVRVADVHANFVQALSGKAVRAYIAFVSKMKITSLRARSLALPLALAAAFPTFAQVYKTLPEVVVTATRAESLASTLISDVTVITREEIESSSGRTLSELIARAAGVSISSNGGLGKSSTVNIRGAEGRHTLLLIDGVRHGSATLGTPNFDNLPLESIERIEVLKGPASSLYGSDAAGGVIQVFMRKGMRGFSPYSSVTVGAGGRRGVSAGLSAGDEQLTYAIGVNSLTEKGFSATNSTVSFGNYNADNDGFSQNGVHVAVNYEVTPSLEVNAKFVQTNATNQYDSSPNTVDVHSKVTTQVGSVGLENRVNESWTTRLSYSNSADKSTNFESSSQSRFDTVQNQVSWTNEVETQQGKVVAGVESLRQRVISSNAYDVTSRITNSVFAGLSHAFGQHSWQANMRLDNNTQFGTAATGLVGYGYRITPNFRVKGSHGTSFVAPSFNTLYWPGYGAPTTQPEKGKNSELGASYALGNQLFSATYFSNRIKGFITTTPVVSNVPYARMKGWSLGHEGESGKWNYRTSVDFLDARNELTNKHLTKRADRQMTATTNYDLGIWKLGASLLTASESYVNAANTQTLGGYGVLDLHAKYALRKNWSVEGRMVNVGDKVYQTASGYNQTGRGAFITLRYQPKQ
jgi:vitamin B12 transporter